MGSESFTWSRAASNGSLCCYTGTDGTFDPHCAASFRRCTATWTLGGAAADNSHVFRHRLDKEPRGKLCFSLNQTPVNYPGPSLRLKKSGKTAFVPRGDINLATLSNLLDSGRLFLLLKRTNGHLERAIRRRLPLFATQQPLCAHVF